MKKLQLLFREIKSPYVVLHKHFKCKGKEHVQRHLDSIVDKGGEGLMLRDPEGKYINKRSDVLLKVKKMFDAEATVIDHVKG